AHPIAAPAEPRMRRATEPSEPRISSTVVASTGAARMKLADDDRRLSRVLLAPALLYIAALVGAPFVLALIYSLTTISLGGHVFGPGTWPIWLGQPRLAMTSIITVHVWRTLPLATVILLGGLSGIPQDIHDAAEVDGAGFFRHMFQITLPLMLPIALVATLFGFVFAFTDMI